MATKKYYFSYKKTVEWDGDIFYAKIFRKQWNNFVLDIDLANPNLISEQDVSLVFDVKVRNLSPDADYNNSIEMSLIGYVPDTKDELSGNYKAFVQGSVNIKSPNDSGLKIVVAADTKSVNIVGETPGKAVSKAFSVLRESFIQTLGDQLINRGFKANRSDPYVDQDPSLPGPPTQTISGITNKAPVVDNPNIKLPSQEVKSLTATSAQEAVQQTSQPQNVVNDTANQTQNTVSDVTNKAQSTVSGVTDQAQNKVSGITNQAQSTVSGVTDQAQSVAGNVTKETGGFVKDGLGPEWSPDKYSPSSIAGNTKYVDPKTGVIGSTSTLAKGLTGAVAGGALGAGIGALAGGGTGALAGGIGGAVAGTGVAIGGVTGGALAGAGLGAGVASIAGGNTATIVGAGVGGAALGAAVAKLNNIKSTMPKPNVPKPPNTPRIKTIKIPRPNDTKGAQALLNLPKSPTL